MVFKRCLYSGRTLILFLHLTVWLCRPQLSQIYSTIHRPNRYPAAKNLGNQWASERFYHYKFRMLYCLLILPGDSLKSMAIMHSPYLRNGPFLVPQCNSTKFQVSVVCSSSGRPKMKRLTVFLTASFLLEWSQSGDCSCRNIVGLL